MFSRIASLRRKPQEARSSEALSVKVGLPMELILYIALLSLPEMGDENAQLRRRCLFSLTLTSYGLKEWAQPLLRRTVRIETEPSRRAFERALKKTSDVGVGVIELQVFALSQSNARTNGVWSTSKSVVNILRACVTLRTLVLHSAYQLPVRVLAECKGLRKLSISKTTVASSKAEFILPHLEALTLSDVTFNQSSNIYFLQPSTLPSLKAFGMSECKTSDGVADWASRRTPLSCSTFEPLCRQIKILWAGNRMTEQMSTRLLPIPIQPHFFPSVHTLAFTNGHVARRAFEFPNFTPTTLRIDMDPIKTSSSLTHQLERQWFKVEGAAMVLIVALTEGLPGVAKLKELIVPGVERAQWSMNVWDSLSLECRIQGVRLVEDFTPEDAFRRAGFWGIEESSSSTP
ncbi:hypothetical protein P7C70_g1000, partial [Phenoliferia sp. Uapishka_3]